MSSHGIEGQEEVRLEEEVRLQVGTAPSAEPVKKPKSGSPTGVVTTKKPTDAKTVETSASTTNESWTVVQLRTRARETGLVGYSGLTKAALLAALGSK